MQSQQKRPQSRRNCLVTAAISLCGGVLAIIGGVVGVAGFTFSSMTEWRVRWMDSTFHRIAFVLMGAVAIVYGIYCLGLVHSLPPAKMKSKGENKGTGAK